MNLQILTGDWIEQLRILPDQSVHCCVTSPPYWGLRDYGTAKWEGGDPNCDHHRLSDEVIAKSDSTRTRAPNQMSNHSATKYYKDVCGKCGAKRVDHQLGLEKTPEEYVAKIVAGFREVWRVLRDDGTIWVNLGDSYARDFAKGGSGPNGKHDYIPGYGDARKEIRRGSGRANGVVTDESPRNRDGTFVNASSLPLKPKDLVGIPWRVAFALQADGWYLRSDIIWHKPNPMPESVTDRPTKSHEYIFLLSKSERYFYDAEAIKEPASPNTHQGYASNGAKTLSQNGEAGVKPSVFDGYRPIDRNKRTVWMIPTAPYAEAHFATFPPDLIKPCILAGCPVGGTVLDPFFGSGTTGQVALELGRNCIGIELNPKYVELARQRCNITPGLQLA